MADRLVIISDIWGIKKGMWITSYLGYLQQYYKIEYYDLMQLANIDPVHFTEETLHKEINEGGMETAVTHLLKKETIPSHYLAFCAGGTVVWKAALKGLPMKSLYAVSPLALDVEVEGPVAYTNLVYGGNDTNVPSNCWADKAGVEMEIVANFGRTMYTDERMIRKVSLDLLNMVTQKVVPMKKVV